MKRQSLKCEFFILTGIIFCLSISCNNKESFTLNQRSIVEKSVLLMADSIAKNISLKGPVAWLGYFENAPGFFMASDGQLVFPNIDTATSFINNVLTRMISKIELHWGNIRIDPLTNKLASLSAVYHEQITDAAGKTTPHDGYFTGIAHQTSQGWKLLNAHWSSITTH